jgi:hypothetical protein
MDDWTSPSAARDSGLRRLRALTIAGAVGAAVLTIVFSVMAAASAPGQSSSGSPSAGTSTPDDQSSFQGPPDGSFGPGGGTPLVVTGGSR